MTTHVRPTTKKTESAKPSRKPAPHFFGHSREGRGSIENRLAGILKDLARVLVSNGYGVAGLNRLAKRAYFEAALELDSAAGRRKSHARIAAVTGLTRAEVSRMNREGTAAADHFPANRAQRISMAWISDRAYCDSRGIPSILPFAGKNGSFERLVRDYSGDIPVRAMFSEMRRLRMIRGDTSNNVQLIRAVTPISRQTVTALRALSPWIGFLSHPNEKELVEMNASSIQFALSFESMPELFAAVRELQSRATSFVNGIHELGSKKKSQRGYNLEISFALGTRVPSSGGAKSKGQGRGDV